MSAPILLARKQRLWLAGIIAVAAGLRFAEIDSLSLSHFDEGSYISSAMTVATGGLYSFPYSQPLHSPPLLPWLIGGLVWLTQAQWPILGVFVSAAFGTGSVLLLFLLGRRWGGNQFGLWAATLLAVSDFHVAYSRMVLTDVPLTFWFLLTLWCVTRMWELAEFVPASPSAGRSDKRQKGSRQPPSPTLTRNRLACIGWGVAAGLAASAAWNTKYNGWLVLAIAATSVGLWVVKEWFAKPFVADQAWRLATQSKVMLGGLLAATIIAAVCFIPWYVYVQQHFPGGYAAVTANHRGYFSSPSAWPGHAYRLIASLAALRHYGWIATLGLVLGLGWRVVSLLAKSPVKGSHLLNTAFAFTFALGLATVVVVQGGDAALFFLGTAGILPALLSKSWPRLLAAVWCGTFVVLTPLYHPYPRLMLPALPACIGLTLWLLDDAWPGLISRMEVEQTATPVATNSRPRLIAGASLALSILLSLPWLFGPHPLGIAAPSRGVWNRWTARQSYRAAGQALLEHTQDDAVIVCQTQLAMISYCPRTPLVAEDFSFQEILEGFPPERACYLLVDFSWIHDQQQSEAMQGVLDHTDSLSPVAVIPNDLSIVTLLDFLTPLETAGKLEAELPPYHLGPNQFLAPPPLTAPFRDVIVLYRVTLPLAR